MCGAPGRIEASAFPSNWYKTWPCPVPELCLGWLWDVKGIGIADEHEHEGSIGKGMGILNGDVDVNGIRTWAGDGLQYGFSTFLMVYYSVHAQGLGRSCPAVGER